MEQVLKKTCPSHSPKLNPIKHLGMRWTTNCEPGRITNHSVPELSDALVGEWEQIPAASLQN